MRVMLFVSLMAAAPPALSAAQDSPTQLVVGVRGDPHFHRPDCAVVKKAGSKVQVQRRSEALRRGLTEHEDCGPENPETAAARDHNARKVVVQKDDNKYHKDGCKKLGKETSAISLEEAGKKYWPCPVCEPPIRKRPGKSQ